GRRAAPMYIAVASNRHCENTIPGRSCHFRPSNTFRSHSSIQFRLVLSAVRIQHFYGLQTMSKLHRTIANQQRRKVLSVESQACHCGAVAIPELTISCSPRWIVSMGVSDAQGGFKKTVLTCYSTVQYADRWPVSGNGGSFG